MPGRDPMPERRGALIRALHAWYEDAVKTIDTRFFDMKTILGMHKGPSAVPGGGMKLVELQGLWMETALYERLRDRPDELKRRLFGSTL